MKIFSIIFTILFFLGFASTSSATWYTITNKSNATVFVHLNKPHYSVPYHIDSITLEPNQCAQLTENQFYNLAFIFVQIPDSTFTVLCDKDKELECEPGNYEVRIKPFLKALFSDNNYTITAVDQANTGICQRPR